MAIKARDVTWPLRVHFVKDNFQIEIESSERLRDWVSQERDFWASISAGQNPHFANAVTRNLNLLPQPNASVLREEIEDIQKSYRPAHGSAGVITARAGDDKTAACIAFAEIVEPNSIKQQNLPSYTWGRSLAAVYHALGGQLTGIEQVADLQFSVRQTLQQVDAIRAGNDEVLKRFQALLIKSEGEWSQKIEGYEARIALSAPREYWKTREQGHSTKAGEARRVWFWSLIGTGLAIPGGFVLWFLLSKPATTLANEISTSVQRVLLLGTVMAFAVWWLRQKLRDLRTHEHLAEDAAERVTMIETYAAMRGAGLQDSDLTPILTALYRSAATGTGEDHGPVLPIELLLRAVGDTARK